MYPGTIIDIKRDVEAILIPTGVKVTLAEGTQAQVTQALGNAYTLYVNGNLVRVDGAHGDALGLMILDVPNINDEEGTLEDKIWTQLKTCFDPEIPVNIVDLGLVYECQVFPQGKEEFLVEIKMTLTAAGCGMGPILVNEVEEKIGQIKHVIATKVDLVFDPPWSREMMTEEAKLQLGML